MIPRTDGITAHCDTCAFVQRFAAPQWVALNGWQYHEGYLTLCPTCVPLYGTNGSEVS